MSAPAAGDYVTLFIFGRADTVIGRVHASAAVLGSFNVVVDDDRLHERWHTRIPTTEGITWLRGAHPPESTQARALIARHLLTR